MSALMGLINCLYEKKLMNQVKFNRSIVKILAGLVIYLSSFLTLTKRYLKK